MTFYSDIDIVQAETIVPGGVQGLDRYAYVNNNPVKYTDPSGHDAGFSQYLSPEECLDKSGYTDNAKNEIAGALLPKLNSNSEQISFGKPENMGNFVARSTVTGRSYTNYIGGFYADDSINIPLARGTSYTYQAAYTEFEYTNGCEIQVKESIDIALKYDINPIGYSELYLETQDSTTFKVNLGSFDSSTNGNSTNITIFGKNNIPTKMWIEFEITIPETYIPKWIPTHHYYFFNLYYEPLP